MIAKVRRRCISSMRAVIRHSIQVQPPIICRETPTAAPMDLDRVTGPRFKSILMRGSDSRRAGTHDLAWIAHRTAGDCHSGCMKCANMKVDV